MDVSSILTNVSSKSVSLFTLIVLLSIFIAVIFFLLALSGYLYKKVRELSRVRYGFGGKPIFSLLIVLGITVAIPFTLYASQQSIEFVKLARAQKDVVVELTKRQEIDGTYVVSFIAIPTINGEYWGENIYDITWTITGDVYFKKVEKSRNVRSPSYFTKNMTTGDYEVEILVEGNNFRVIKYEELNLK